jgi:hypothetical protein
VGGDGGDHPATTLLTAVHIDAAARKSTQFEPHISLKSQAMVSAEPARRDTWPPERALLG